MTLQLKQMLRNYKVLGLLFAVLFAAFLYSIHDVFEQHVVEAGEKAPGFAVTTESGQKISTKEFGGKLLVLNFWATWCPPCVTEMPLLAGFHRERKAWNVVGIAVDQADPVRAFVAEHRIELPVVLGGADGLQLSRTLGNAAGGLPFSVAYATDGRVVERKLGALDAALLARWAETVR